MSNLNWGWLRSLASLASLSACEMASRAGGGSEKPWLSRMGCLNQLLSIAQNRYILTCTGWVGCMGCIGCIG